MTDQFNGKEGLKVCDNCKREPEPFDVDGVKDKGYFFVVPKADLNPSYLMSDLTFSFLVCLDKEPPDDNNNNEYWCVNCIDAIKGDCDD